MIKFGVLNRFSGAVQFTAEIECDDSASAIVKLGLAVKWAVANKVNLAGANLAGADLAGADLADANLAGADLAGADLADAYFVDANLAGADLAHANLAGADLAGADLADAYFVDANLARANLAGADLAGANLAGANLADLPLIDGGLRSDGYRFFVTAFEPEGLRIKAGCRCFESFETARAHWRATRGGTALGDETFAILDHLERMAVGRRLIPA